MIRVSKNYKQQMVKPIRNRGFASVSLGIINQEAQKDAAVVSDVVYYSQGDIFTGLKNPVTYATMEQNFFVCDGSMYFPPEIANTKGTVTDLYYDKGSLEFETEHFEVYARDNGAVARDLGESIVIELGKEYNVRGLTIDFGNAFPTHFIVESDSERYEYRDNYNTRWETEDFFGTTTQFTITPLEMVGGEQRLRIVEFLFGVGISFTNETSAEITVDEHVSDISAELSYKNFKATVYDQNGRFDVDNDKSFMSFLEPGQKITTNYGILLDNGEIEWHQKGVSYLKDWTLKKYTLTINSTDRLAQFKEKYTAGNKIYDRTAYEECVSILTDLGLEPDEYHIDTYLQSVPLHNPMPEMSHAECLQLLCNATRCVVFEDAEGIIQIKGNFATVLDPENIDVETDNKTLWSKPQNLFKEVNAQYADMSYNMGNVDGTVYYLPVGTNYLETGYVSESIAKAAGTFDKVPYVDIMMPATFSYFGVKVEFGDVVPEKVKLTTLLDGEIVDEYIETNIEQESTFMEELAEFNVLRIEILKTHANARAIINRVSFGDASDYVLTSDLITENPDVFKEERTKDIWVKVYKFENDEEGKPKEVEDANYVIATLDTSGETRTCENPLIHTREMAETAAYWFTSHYKNNVSYNVKYRGDPKIEAKDIIGLESKFVNNLQVNVETASISFNGGFSGNLELRRYIYQEPEELQYVELPVQSSSIMRRVDTLEGNFNTLDNKVSQIDTKSVDNYYSGRPTSADLGIIGDGKLRHFKATSAMTTGKPASDGHILHMAWDNTDGWDSELFIPNSGIAPQWRFQNKGAWTPWYNLLTLIESKLTTKVKTNAAVTVAGSYAIESSTIPDAINEIRYKNGCFGSVYLKTAYIANNVTIPATWYNYLWMPHRDGGTGTAGSGDNHNYGTMLLTKMTSRSNEMFLVNYYNGTITVSRFASTN